MTNPIYDIPMSEPGGPAGGAPGGPPPGVLPFHSPAPTVAPDGSPVSGVDMGNPSAAPVAPPSAPETAYDAPPMSAPADPFGAVGGFPPPVAGTAQQPLDSTPLHDLDAPAAEGILDLDAPYEVPSMPPPSAFDDIDEEPHPLPLLDLDAPVPTFTAPAPAPRRAMAVDPDLPELTASVLESIASMNPGAPVPDQDIISGMQQVLKRGASDLHVAAGAQPLLRVDGGLSVIPGSEVWDRDKVRSALYSLLSPKMIETFEDRLELDFAYTLNDAARFRVNFYQDRGAMGAALRIIPTEIKTLRDLGISPEVGHFSTLPRGLVLVTGPTGSGKSTTLAALIDLVNETRRDHVVTVEDPIEFMHRNKRSLINQREVGRDTHSFGNALKHVLRQDPDVILIGEMRDIETIGVALTAAETGHLVFATLHTQSAPTTIDRVIDVFPPHQQDQVRTQLAATLKGVVCQTLVKRASGHGRSVATEVMFTTPAISNLVREGKTYQITSVLQSGLAQGMHTMDQALAELVNDGTITKATAMEKSQDPETLERLITRVDMGNAGDSMFTAASYESVPVGSGH